MVAMLANICGIPAPIYKTDVMVTIAVDNVYSDRNNVAM